MVKHNVSLGESCQLCQYSSSAGIQALDWHRSHTATVRKVKTNTSDTISRFNNEKVTVNILLGEHRVLDSKTVGQHVSQFTRPDTDISLCRVISTVPNFWVTLLVCTRSASVTWYNINVILCASEHICSIVRYCFKFR